MDVFLVLLLLSGFCVPSASFPNIYHFVNENMTWDEARAYCIKEYLGLAQITYPENNIALMNTPTGEYTGKAWIGLHMGTIGWFWLDGRPSTYYSWSLSQPLYTGTGYCVSTDYKGWYSVRCTEKLGFICFDGRNYITYRTLVTWNEAKTSCENKNSILAQILDVETFDKVSIIVDKKMWIGLSFSPVWLWSETKQISTFMNWKTGQPNIENNCAAVLVEDGTWTTEPCSEQYPFFCYAVYKSKKTVVSMNIQTDANLENPDNQAALMQQLEATLGKQGVTDFKLTWTKQPVQKSKQGDK